MFLTKKVLGITLLFGLFIAGCSDNATSPEDEDSSVHSVLIEPIDMTFDAIGQNKQFTAKAYDETGGEITTDFSWSSSNDEVVTIAADGMAKSTGPGTANIYVTAGEKVDTAQVAVELAEDPTIWWISSNSGNWDDATKWSTGTVPQADDTVAIPLDGTYTVTLTEDVSVKYLILGASEGTQTLATGSNQITVEDGILSGGAELQIDGKAIITGRVEWEDGDIIGNGTINLNSSAEVNAGDGGDDSKLTLKAALKNEGTFAILSGVSILMDGGSFENVWGAEIDFQSDNTSLSTINGGTITNAGDLVKSAGDGHAYISVSSPETFMNSGYLGVESGTLNIRDGELDGVIDIGEDAVLRQSGTTLLHNTLVSRGDGVFEIGGIITLGEETGELIRLRHVLLESILTNSISGPGNLRIDGSLLWHKGSISGAGEIFISAANAKLEGSGTKSISERKFVIQGSLETESLLDLKLSNGAQLVIDRDCEWTHTGGGKISTGIGDQPAVIITDTFRKKGIGSLTIEADFICAGEMYLNEGEGVFTVKGAFDLQKSGKLIGGSPKTDNEINYRILQVPEATSAVLAGTIEVDADGEPAFMSILGAVTIDTTFKLLIDVDNKEPIPAERLTFATGGVKLAGTLEVNVKSFPPDGAQYKVVSTVDATGEFGNVVGADVFNTIQQDQKGVLLIRDGL